VQMCVTSPPYFGLRSYLPEGHPDKHLELGLEETPEQYVERMVSVFREVRRVLADDGTLWLNIGDSYASASTYNAPRTSKGEFGRVNAPRQPNAGVPRGCKPKDLIGIPWMLAFALRADGWYLRQDIIWHKPNPMPESVRHRCTKAPEYLFLLSKSERYYLDAEAMKEPAVGGQSSGASSFKRQTSKRGVAHPGQSTGTHRPDRPDVEYNGEMRNRRSVWSVATRPYQGAHFAVFPPDLIEPCISGGTSDRGHCAQCGRRWERIVDRTPMVINKTDRNEARGTRTGTSGTMVAAASTRTIGWQPTCNCGGDPVPDIVFDPFGGSGTTASVSRKRGRHAILCELNTDYLPLIDARLKGAV